MFDTFGASQDTDRMDSLLEKLRSSIPVLQTADRYAAIVGHTLPMIRQAGLLAGLEIAAHAIDYFYHIYLGRSLSVAAFGSFQSFFSLAMILTTMAGVLQSVVARDVAAPPQTVHGPASPGAVVRAYLWQGGLVGGACLALMIVAQRPLANVAGLPVGLLGVIALLMPLAMLRPVVQGLQQGLGRFGHYGSINLFYAAARMALALVGLGLLGLGVQWAAMTLLIATGLTLLFGLLLAYRQLRQPGRLPLAAALTGWRLSLAVLVIGGSSMALTGLDVVWANRIFAPSVAGAYARGVVLRRIVALLPSAAVIIVLPRAASAVRAGQRPDRLVALASGIVLISGLGLSLFYSWAGGYLDTLAFGASPISPEPWLVGMAIATTAYGLNLVWCNVYIATRPWPYAWMLAATVVVQVVLYAWIGSTPEAVVTILAMTSWMLALAGALLYLFWLRPQIGPSALDADADLG